MRIVIATALLIAAAPAVSAPRAAADVHSFVVDGESYEYVASRNAHGTITLDGRTVASDTPFRLTVRDRRVSGKMGATPVDFLVPAETRAKLDSELATPAFAASTN